MSQFIAYQSKFRQELPEIRGSKDYHDYRQLFQRLDALLDQSGIEREIVRKYMEIAERDGYVNYRKGVKLQEKIRKAFRCSIARHLTGLSYREFSARLADSPVLQKFCRLDEWVGVITIPSKSQCHRYEAMFTPEMISHVITELNRVASDSMNSLTLKTPVSLDEFYIDSTCVAANIHFPVDWVLLRDAVRTLMKATILIRNSGLKHRMASPQEFIRAMNRLCIEMTHTRRRKDGKRRRKGILRAMKKLCRKVAAHAKRHMSQLIDHWQDMGWSEYQAFEVVARIERILEQLPQAIYQAHERIIGDRRVPNHKKILSLYEREIHVVVRGKASGETEFGNTLLLAEQADGLIVEWEFFEDRAPHDSQCLISSLRRFKSRMGRYPVSVTGDRGFHSPANDRFLADSGITNAICPKSVKALKERMMEPEFVLHQWRRNQTEGRIGIIQNVFLGTPLRSKGFYSRHLNVELAILTHNLWVLARLPVAEEEKIKKRHAA